MSIGTIVKGFLNLGLIRTYKNNKLYQPIGNIYEGLNFPPAGLILNTQRMLRNTEPERTAFPTSELFVYYTAPKLITHWGIYVLGAAVGSGHYAYYNYAEHVELPAGDIPESRPTIRIENGGNISVYFWVWFHQYVSESFLYKNFERVFTTYEKPYYAHLITGYPYDTKSLPTSNPKIIPEVTEEVTIGFYRNNHLEPIQGLTSIDWITQQISLTKGVGHYLYLQGIVLGTLYVISGSSKILDLLTALPVENEEHSYTSFLPQGIDDLFSHWNSITNPTNLVFPDNFTEESRLVSTETSRELNKLSANNNHWHNDNEFRDDINSSRFELENQRAYEWHIRPQVDGSRGNLIMNSPTIVNIGLALEAEKYAVNELDNKKPRISTLGYYIERQSGLLGHRVDANGQFDPAKEKKLVKQVIDSRTRLDPKKIGVNGFGDEGMVMHRLNNRFKGEEVVSDQCVVVQDYLQVLGEYQDQLNLALGIQESSAIQIKNEDDKSKSRYHNQLEILIEILNLVHTTSQMARNTLISSLVTQGQSSELISGLGLPSVTKTIPIEIDSKSYDLPYKGIAAHRSISQEVATCTANVGIVLGQLL